MSRQPAISIPVEQRFATGCIATLTDGADTVTRHFTGSGTEATRAVAHYCDAHGLRVVTLSTPMTVYRDLQGWRRQDEPTQRKRVASLEKIDDRLSLPERLMLQRIHRMDLIA